MTARLVPVLALIAIGAGWGISIPLPKIAIPADYLATIHLSRAMLSIILSAILTIAIVLGNARFSGRRLTAQVSYLFTLFGIFWAVVLFSEAIPVQLWLALALVMTGLSLVQPRRARQATGATPDGPAL